MVDEHRSIMEQHTLMTGRHRDVDFLVTLQAGDHLFQVGRLQEEPGIKSDTNLQLKRRQLLKEPRAPLPVPDRGLAAPPIEVALLNLT